MRKLVWLLPVFLLVVGCEKKTMNLPRASYTVVQEVEDHSPLYFEIDPDHSDSIRVNDSNLISSTHFILSVSRDLNLLSVLKKTQEVKDKKYKDKIHPDDKEVYFSYADTLHKQLAFFPIKDLNYGFFRPKSMDKLLYMNASRDLFFEDYPIELEDLPNRIKGLDDIQLGFSKALSFEHYLQLRVHLTALGIEEQFTAVDMIY